MNVKLIQVGKTTERHVRDGVAQYESRLKRYCKYETITIKPATKGSPQEVSAEEGERIRYKLRPSDYVILLDETGKGLTSVQFANHLQSRMTAGTSDFIFIIGGAWGHDQNMHKRANLKLALSPMTFPHQLVRLIYTEQLYRAMTILRNEPYHH